MVILPKKKTVISLLVSLFFTVATMYGQTNNENPSLNLITISTEKDHFLLQEPIWIFINFKNTTKDTLRINRTTLREGLRVGVIQGGRVPKYLRFSGIPTSFVVPGDSLFALVDLNTYYGTTGGLYIGWRFIPAGHYRVYIKLPSYRITSDTIEITVSEPEGEELKAMNLLTEGMKLSETVGGERDDEVDHVGIFYRVGDERWLIHATVYLDYRRVVDRPYPPEYDEWFVDIGAQRYHDNPQP